MKFGSRGFIKIGAVSSIAIALAVVSVLYVVPALANVVMKHSSSVTIYPNLVKCGTNGTFTITITHTGDPSTAPIWNVKIYNDTNAAHKDFSCGPAPTGWTAKPYDTINSYCEYVTSKDPTNTNLINPGESLNFTFSANITEQCSHGWQTATTDILQPVGWVVYNYPTITADCTPPVTTKSFVGPQKIDGGVEWIDGVTKINLTAIDNPPHPSGVNATYYRITTADDEVCYDPDNLCGPIKSEVSFQLYTGPIGGIDESCHRIEVYSVDNVGNIENAKANCFFVDKTPPVIDKQVGRPSVEGDGKTVDWWVNQSTPITLNCQDVGPHPSNDVTIYWNYTVDGGSLVSGSYKGETKTLYFPEDSVHVLEFWCKDAVQKESKHDIETFKVDTVPPVITKTMLGTNGVDYLGACPPQSASDNCYVADNRKGGVNVTVQDGGAICAVDQVQCSYELWWYQPDEGDCEAVAGPGKWNDETGWCKVEEGNFNNYKEIIFTQDSNHTLKVWCQDSLGNPVYDEETFLVDSTPPVTTKTYGQPYVYGSGPEEWINSSTPIYLNATDEKVGVNKTYWRNLLVVKAGEDTCWVPQYCHPEYYSQYVNIETPWNESTGPFYKQEESCHVIEYYSVDKLGNKEDVKWQCVFVDNTPPNVWKSVFTPKINCTESEGCQYWITNKTKITISCNDVGNHTVGRETKYWRYKVDDGNWSNWSMYTGPIYFNEDSVHTLQYYCVDGLGNAAQIKEEIDKVDSTPPVITRTVGTPNVTKDGWIYVRDHVTPITVNAVDPDPTGKGCNIDSVTCRWWVYLDDQTNPINSSNGTVGPQFTIIFNEDSIHKLVVNCTDALGNKATNTTYYKVDSTPPRTDKIYYPPCYPTGGSCREAEPVWLSNTSSITLKAWDVGSCKVGVDQIWYRVTLVNDSYCQSDAACKNATGSGDFIDTTPPEETKTFTIPNESCHLIEYYSVDLLGNKEETKRQCVYIDTTGPNVTKTIGEPKEKWAGDNTFYPNLTQRCWGSGLDAIECWKITLMTQIKIDCVDPEPHPVDHNNICFSVELDGDDKTGEYCHHRGTIIDGFCCVNYETYTFMFDEESQHDLKVYCKDALGNKGPMDEEKFKVEGTAFTIPLYEKWNLISVPFVLLNDNIIEVFKDIANETESVWTYDNQTGWHVYTPDGVANDDLNNVLPGWGYWVLAKNDTTLTIGGSLFSPARTPPSRILLPGWNLIGYYGTDWQEYGDDPWCSYNSIYWRYAYCSLNSLVDTQEGNPRWSSLWTYVNCGDVEWKRLKACTTSPSKNKMVAGYGYWIEMDVSDIYAPATVCYKQTNCVYQ